MSRTREIQIGDLFTIERGKSRYTRSYAEANPGDVPLYSAALGGPMAYCHVGEFSGPLLTFTTNGYAGTVQVVEGDFLTNGDRAVLLPRQDVHFPDLRYLARTIEQAIRPLAVGRRADAGRNEYTKISPKTVGEVRIPLLVDENGDDDLDAMVAFGDAIERTSVLQANLQARVDQLREADVVLDAGESLEIELGDESCFSRPKIGKRVLRADLTGGGDIPVYSANVLKPMGFVSETRAGDAFDSASLIWGIDGVFDWNLIPANQPFVPTDHCGRIQVTDDRLDPHYLLYALRATKGEHGFDRVFRSNLSNIARLSVAVPIDSTGAPDLHAQRELASRYEKLDQIRDEVIARVSTITGVVVVPR